MCGNQNGEREVALVWVLRSAPGSLLSSSIKSGCSESQPTVKGGFYLKAVFTPPKIGLTEISRSRFKQYKNPTLISQINVLGCFVNFLVIFRYIWEEIVFLKRVVKFGEIRNS